VRAALLLIAVSRVAVADDAPLLPGEVADTVAGAIAKRDPAAPKGVGRKLAKIANTADPRAVRDALVANGLAIVDEREAAGVLVLTVEAKGGGRATLWLGPDGGEVAVIANPSTVKPPGACVAVPEVKHPLYVHSSAIGEDGKLHEVTTFWGFHTVRLADVDGDGILDAFVPIAKPHDCPEDIQWRVFVMRGACGHDVGIVGKGTIVQNMMGAVSASGFRPIVVASRSSSDKSKIPEIADTTTTFVFSPKLGRYVQSSVKSSPGGCYHCGRWSCSPAP
jgi:hypothetical protein